MKPVKHLDESVKLWKRTYPRISDPRSQPKSEIPGDPWPDSRILWLRTGIVVKKSVTRERTYRVNYQGTRKIAGSALISSDIVRIAASMFHPRNTVEMCNQLNGTRQRIINYIGIAKRKVTLREKKISRRYRRTRDILDFLELNVIPYDWNSWLVVWF